MHFTYSFLMMNPDEYQPSGTLNYFAAIPPWQSSHENQKFLKNQSSFAVCLILDKYMRADKNSQDIIDSINIIKRFLMRTVLRMDELRERKTEMLEQLIFVQPSGFFPGGIEYQKGLGNFEHLLEIQKKT